MDRHEHVLRGTVNEVFWSLLMQGVAFVILGILIIIYPVILVALASTVLLFVGLMLIVFAVRVRRLWKMLPKMLQDL